MDTPSIATLLGGLSPAQFLDEYWQKKPLLVRQAIPGFQGLASRETLFSLATDPDVESRRVSQRKGQWALQHGPQKPKQLRETQYPWTILIQGLNLWVPEADRLLQHFRFIPKARLDDLMVSYAIDGGGVGPHFDDYDVFLLQGTGRRRWQIGNQADREWLDDVPLKILRDFRPCHDWVLEPGDMLYLPPNWAHNGIAQGECTTYSIGFRSLSAQEVATGFLAYLQDTLELPGLYTDPDLRLQDNSAEIGPAMLAKVGAMIGAVRWDGQAVRDFLGCYLTEPKPQVFFEAPDAPMDEADFSHSVATLGFHLDARTQLLFADTTFFINGEVFTPEPCLRGALARLAHERELPPSDAWPAALLACLHEWYCDGFGAPGTFEG